MAEVQDSFADWGASLCFGDEVGASWHLGGGSFEIPEAAAPASPRAAVAATAPAAGSGAGPGRGTAAAWALAAQAPRLAASSIEASMMEGLAAELLATPPDREEAARGASAVQRRQDVPLLAQQLSPRQPLQPRRETPPRRAVATPLRSTAAAVVAVSPSRPATSPRQLEGLARACSAPLLADLELTTQDILDHQASSEFAAVWPWGSAAGSGPRSPFQPMLPPAPSTRVARSPPRAMEAHAPPAAAVAAAPAEWREPQPVSGGGAGRPLTWCRQATDGGGAGRRSLSSSAALGEVETAAAAPQDLPVGRWHERRGGSGSGRVVADSSCGSSDAVRLGRHLSATAAAAAVGAGGGASAETVAAMVSVASASPADVEVPRSPVAVAGTNGSAPEPAKLGLNSVAGIAQRAARSISADGAEEVSDFASSAISALSVAVPVRGRLGDTSCPALVSDVEQAPRVSLNQDSGDVDEEARQLVPDVEADEVLVASSPELMSSAGLAAAGSGAAAEDSLQHRIGLGFGDDLTLAYEPLFVPGLVSSPKRFKAKEPFGWDPWSSTLPYELRGGALHLAGGEDAANAMSYGGGLGLAAHATGQTLCCARGVVDDGLDTVCYRGRALERQPTHWPQTRGSMEESALTLPYEGLFVQTAAWAPGLGSSTGRGDDLARGLPAAGQQSRAAHSGHSYPDSGEDGTLPWYEAPIFEAAAPSISSGFIANRRACDAGGRGRLASPAPRTVRGLASTHANSTAGEAAPGAATITTPPKVSRPCSTTSSGAGGGAAVGPAGARQPRPARRQKSHACILGDGEDPPRWLAAPAAKRQRLDGGPGGTVAGVAAASSGRTAAGAASAGMAAGSAASGRPAAPAPRGSARRRSPGDGVEGRRQLTLAEAFCGGSSRGSSQG